MTTLYDHDRAQVLQDAAAQFWTHIIPVVQIAFAIHVVLFCLCLMLPIPVLAVANVASIVVYVACLRAIKAGRHNLAGTLISVEIIAHALLATWVLGWDSNFHFYLFCIVPIIAFSFQTALLKRLLLYLSILLVAVGCFALRSRMGLAASVSPMLLEVFGIVNALAATALLLHATGLSVRFTLAMQLSLFHTAHHDSLTNLYTRRRVLQRVRELGARPAALSSAIILLDIDHFKQINDLHGHELGDVILQRVADSIRASVRATDMASRWGGEEFLVLLPETASAEAAQVAERILQSIRQQAGQVEEGPLAISATVAMVVQQPGEAFDDALGRADQLLYVGKQQGRDRVMTAG